MMRFIPLAAFAVMAACAGGGPAPTPAAVAPVPQLSAKDRLVSAIKGQGCVVNINTIQAVLTNAAVGNDEMASLINELDAEGRVEAASDGEIRLLSSNCI